MDKIKEYLKGKLPNSQFTAYDDYTILQLLWKIIIPTMNCFIDDFKLKTDLHGDHKGSWQGLDKPTLSEEGMRSTVEKHIEDIKNIFLDLFKIREKINKISYLVSDFEHLKEGDDWTKAIQECIKVATEKGGNVLVDKIYDIYDTITIPSGCSIHGIGFTWGGVTGFNLKTEGKTAILVTGQGITLENFVVKCSTRYGQTTHGIILDDNANWHSFNNYKNLRIINFNGTGIKFDSIHDSVIENISVEFCGNSTYPALQITSHNDTTNHCIFNRIQVEQSYYKALYIDEKVMNCTFNNIHSERTLVDTNYRTHFLTGYRNTYENVRIENATSEKNRVVLGGANNSYNDFRLDGTTRYEYGVRNESYLNNCNFDTFECVGIAVPVLEKCVVGTLSISNESVKVFNSIISNLSCFASQGIKTFKNTTITTLNVNSTNFINAKFVNCKINSDIAYQGAYLAFESCEMLNYKGTYCNINIKNCLLQDFIYDGAGAYKRYVLNSHIKGNVVRIGSGNIVAINNFVEGTNFQKYESTDKISLPVFL